MILELGLAEGEEEWRPGTCAVYAYRKHAQPFIKAGPHAARLHGDGNRPRHRYKAAVIK
jgi:hypothetical protein